LGLLMLLIARFCCCLGSSKDVKSGGIQQTREPIGCFLLALDEWSTNASEKDAIRRAGTFFRKGHVGLPIVSLIRHSEVSFTGYGLACVRAKFTHQTLIASSAVSQRNANEEAKR